MEQKQIISLTTEVKCIKENRLQLGNRKKNDKNKIAEKQNDKDKDNCRNYKLQRTWMGKS